MTQQYDDYRSEIAATQKDKSYEEVREEMQTQSKHIVELDRLQPQRHIWVDRGAVMSCEYAGHPNHHAVKIRR